MKRSHRLFPIYCFLFVFHTACDQQADDGGRVRDQNTEQQSPAQQEEAATEVEVFELVKSPFRRELLANGTLEAVRRADLKFSAVGIIKTIEVSDGDRVKAGHLLATLANDVQMHALEQSKLRIRKAHIDYEDILLQQGYRIKDTLSIPMETRETARLRSGLTEAELDMRRVERELNDTYLFAPFDGTVANMKARVHNGTADFEHICTVVDDSELFAKFSVMEQEMPFIRASQTIHVSPFSDGNARYRAALANVNPMVDKSGMVTVRAKIRNSQGKLVDGMGVGVSIGQTVAGQIVVPKEAVLDRQGKKVVFTVSDEGRAHWNYVDIGMENSEQYTIENGLKPGDRVIYNGNFNLAHDKPVVLIEN